MTAALSGLVAANRILLRRNSRAPKLYGSGVRYQAEPRGSEKWQTIPQVIAAGRGDCEDLASWRAAELQEMGIPAKAVVIRTGRRMYHAVVLLPDGRLEDPSRRLGMKKSRGQR